ncbi:protein takeout [Cochliomyia hominivorax]
MKHLIKIFASLLLAAAVVEAKYLAEKPNFFLPCQLKDPEFNRCFAKNFQAIPTQWKDGIPGFKEGGTFDPLLVKRIVIAQDPNNPVALNAELADVVIRGIGNMQVKDANFNSNTLVTRLKLFVPKLRFDSNYKVDGRILNLPLKGNGKAVFEIDNIELFVNLKLKLRDEYGHTFTDIAKLQAEVGDVGGFHIHLGNLFNGQKDLEESTNAVLNESWRNLFEVLRPSITEAVQVVLNDRLSKAFSHVPADYFIADIASVAQH